MSGRNGVVSSSRLSAVMPRTAAETPVTTEPRVVRPDVTIDEVVRMVGGIAKIPAEDPAEIQRVLAVALDGLRYRAG
jgi:hypothetical protein